MLTADEIGTLDQYNAQMATVSAAPAQQPAASAPDAYTAPNGAPYAAPAATTPTLSAPPASNAAAADATAEAASAHEAAAALVSQAREAMARGRKDEARNLARQAEGLNATFGPSEDSPARVIAEIDGVAPGAAGVHSSNPREDRQRARWLLRQSREQIALGNLNEAEAKLTEARGLNVRYNLFGEDTPNKVAETIEKARAKAATANPSATAPHDRKAAAARLKEARQLLAAGQVDQAEAIALDVGSWGLHFGVLGDSPAKVTAAVRAVKRREASRKSGSNAGLQQDIYDIQVQEARQLLASGKLDEAEAKALNAQRLNVAPALTSDRAEAVLHDVEMQRARTNPKAPAVTPPAELASAAAEREANERLKVGDREGFAQKSREAELLQAQESGQQPAAAATPAQAPAPANDAALLRTQGDAPAAADPNPPSLDPIGAQAPAVPPANAPATAPAPAAPAPAMDPVLTSDPATTAASPAGNNGQALLEKAHALLTAGNFSDAKEAATQAKTGGFGLDAQADEVLSQIALAQQAGALKMYESAVAAARKQDFEHARQILTELAATDIQDETLLQKVQDLLTRMPGEKAGKASVTPIVEDVEMVKAQKLNI
jgi:hypothetical protein